MLDFTSIVTIFRHIFHISFPFENIKRPASVTWPKWQFAKKTYPAASTGMSPVRTLSLVLRQVDVQGSAGVTVSGNAKGAMTTVGAVSGPPVSGAA